MREIKFRAWYKKEKKMVYEGWITFMGQPWNCALHSRWPGQSQEHNYELLQYTGLKDKNGKEIYEGDIVKSDNGEKAEVRWSDVRLGWNMVYQRYELPLFERFLEVIGNIYENKDLIK